MPNGLTDAEHARITHLMEKHKDIIAKCGVQLATNFEVPAQRIINAACAEMGIERLDWEKIEAVRNNTKLMDNRTTRPLALKIRDVIEPSEWQCQNGCGVFESAEEETLP